MRNASTITALLLTTTLACAHTPGRWEKDLISKNAPNATLAVARDCDDKDGIACLKTGNYYMSVLKDYDAAHATAMESCNLGLATACTLAGTFKKAGETMKSASSTTTHAK